MANKKTEKQVIQDASKTTDVPPKEPNEFTEDTLYQLAVSKLGFILTDPDLPITAAPTTDATKTS